MEGSVKTVENIFQNGIFKGLIVNSIVDEKQIKQIIISQDSDEAVFEDRSLSIKFEGRYAIITLDNRSAFTDVYIGSGSSLSFQEWLFKSVDAKPISLCLNKSNNFANIISTTTFEIMNPKNFTINKKIINL